MTYQEIASEIENSDLKVSELDALKSLIDIEIENKALTNGNIFAGEVRKAHFVRQISPSYLSGLECIVHGPAPFRGSTPKVYVSLPSTAPARALARFGTRRLRTPITLLEFDD